MKEDDELQKAIDTLEDKQIVEWLKELQRFRFFERMVIKNSIENLECQINAIKMKQKLEQIEHNALNIKDKVEC